MCWITWLTSTFLRTATKNSRRNLPKLNDRAFRLTTIFLEVINKRIFKEYSYTIAIIFAFAFPLFHRIEPIIIKYIDKKEFEAVVKENDVKTLVSWFKAMQDFESAKIRMLKE
jgi:hypothetical protein